MALVLRSEPCPDESYYGYLLRLSSLNHLPSLYAVFGREHNSAQHLSRRKFNRTLLLNLDVSSALGIDPAALNRLPYRLDVSRQSVFRFFGEEIQAWYIDLSSAKICPLCLAEKPYLPATWDLTLWISCPIHDKLLVHTCPHCGSRLRWKRRDLRSCGKCQFSLVLAPTQNAPKVISNFTKLLNSKLTGSEHNIDAPGNPWWDDCSFSDLMCLCANLGRPLTHFHRKSIPPGGRPPRINALRIVEAFGYLAFSEPGLSGNELLNLEKQYGIYGKSYRTIRRKLFPLHRSRPPFHIRDKVIS